MYEKVEAVSLILILSSLQLMKNHGDRTVVAVIIFLHEIVFQSKTDHWRATSHCVRNSATVSIHLLLFVKAAYAVAC